MQTKTDTTESKDKKEGITENITGKLRGLKKRYERKVSWFHNRHIITPNFIISHSDTIFKYFFYRIENKGSWRKKAKRHQEYIEIPIKEMLVRSLNLSNINHRSKSDVQKFALSLIHDFMLTLEDMMIKENVLFRFPFPAAFTYIFLAKTKFFSPFSNYEERLPSGYRQFNTWQAASASVTPVKRQSKIYLLHTFDFVTRRHDASKRIPGFYVGLKKSAYSKIDKSIAEGRQYLPYSNYSEFILRKRSSNILTRSNTASYNKKPL